ncbi:MAG: LytR C-terminal domain-containing protein [Mycobacteriales bacterium]
MRIPGGDLVPARHRRYGGSYGRRRRRRGRRVLALLLLIGLGAAGAWYLRKDDAATTATVSTSPTCEPTPTATPTPAAVAPRVALPPTTAVVLSVLNGTDRSLLAKHVADALATQGFQVTGQANARTAVAGPSQIVYGPGASLQARTVSLWVPGSTVVPAPKARRGSVQVILGSSFTRVATPAEAAAARRGPVATATTAPSATPTVLRCRA